MDWMWTDLVPTKLYAEFICESIPKNANPRLNLALQIQLIGSPKL